MRILDRISLFLDSPYYPPLLLFLLASAYVAFFTVGIPFFWDDHQFHEHFLSYAPSYWIKETLTTNIFSLHLYDSRGVYALFVSTLFMLFEYDFAFYRFVKALIFGGYITALYFLAAHLFKNRKLAFFLMLFPIFSFPVFIHTFVFDEPLIIMELFKILAFIFFLSGYQTFKEKQVFSYSTFFLFFLFTFLATRTYITGYAIYGALPLFLFLDNQAFFKKHRKITLLLFILGCIFTFGALQAVTTASPHGNSTFPFTHTFLVGWFEIAASPFITFDDLYYKPFASIISFFGIWSILLASLFWLLRFLRLQVLSHFVLEQKNQNTPIDKTVLFFLLCWLLSELPLWFSLPEHAIRYSSAIIPSITFLVGFFFMRIFSSLLQAQRKYFILLLTVALLGAILTNFLYVSAYRVGWGSSFIAMDKAAYTVLDIAPENSVALYFGQSAADDYLTLTLEPGNYTLQKTIPFVKTGDSLAFEPNALEDLRRDYGNIYVLQRASPEGTLYPPLSLEERMDLEYVTLISGLGNNPFDFFYSQIALIGKDPPTTTVTVYRYT